MPQYSGVWNLAQQAQALTSQQWVTDPNFKNTTLLLQADNAANGAQNNTFLDSSSNAFAITRNGNTTQGSFTPFSQSAGWWSNNFSGTSNSNYLSVPRLLDSTVDITLEFWIFPTAGISANGSIFASQYDGTADRTLFYMNTGNVLAMQFGTTFVNSATVLQLNTWTHIAFVRSGNGTNNWSQYINGIRDGQTTYTGSYANTAFTIGASPGLASNQFQGYISNMRLIKGTALYSGTSFPVPTIPFSTSTTNQALLTCSSNAFADTNTATTAKTITVAGTPSVQAFSPFAPQYQWTPTVIGGSGYFDGTGDYLAFPTSNATLLPSTGQFTFELWFYCSSTAFQTLFSYGTNTGNLRVFIQSGGLQVWNGASQFTAGNTTLIKYGGWNHVVVQRNATNLVTYVNGTRDYNTANSTNFSAGSLQVGADAGGSLFTGYISGFSYIKGSATYSGTPITLPTAPPLPTGTTACLNFTNAGIYDATMKNDLETVGNAQVSTTVVKYGSGSMYFDGTGDYLTIPSTKNLSFGTGDFTVEMWIFRNNNGCDLFFVGGAATGAIEFYINGSNQIRLSTYSGVTESIIATSTGTISAATWTHIAATRTGGYVRLFINGVLDTSVANSTNFSLQTPITIGANSSGTAAFNGYLDDYRVTKGLARYVTSFLPPQVALPRQ